MQQPTPSLHLHDSTEEAGGASDPSAIWGEQHRLQIEDFTRAVVDGREPFMTGEMALEPLRVILSIYESAKSNGARVEIQMRFGVCCSDTETPVVLSAGFDYVELPANLMVQNHPDYCRFPCKATNLFFPPWIRLIGPEATPYRDYVAQLLRCASEVGIETMVIGSGGSRRAPDGMDHDEALETFVDVVKNIHEMATESGIVIAPESLNRNETNVGNDLRELAQAMEKIGAGYTADSYHILIEWDATNIGDSAPSEDYWREQIPYCPSHVHIADLPRLSPRPSDYMMEGFANRLREVGYDNKVSLECKREGNFDFAQALADLKEIFQEN